MINMFSGVSQVIIALAVAWIAWQQYKITKRQAYIDSQRIKHELFDRRLAFINETKLYIKPWNIDDKASFDLHMQKAYWLFPDSAVSQLVIMAEIGNKFMERSARKDLHPSETPESRRKRLEADAVEKLNIHYGRFVKSVDSLMKIEEYRTDVPHP